MTLRHARSVRPSLKLLCAGTLALLAGVSAAPAQGKRPVLIFGDSLMQLISRSVTKNLAAYPAVEPMPLVSIGSGLARLDLFDWPAKLQEKMGARPEAAVVLMGANDNQPMKTDAGVVEMNTPGWSAEYARRVDTILQTLQAGGVKHLIWIGLPDMRDPGLQKDTREINRIVLAQTQGKSWVTFIDTVPLFSTTAGKFSPYIQKKDGMPLMVRSADGVHLNKDGADFIAGIVVQNLAGAMGLK